MTPFNLDIETQFPRGLLQPELYMGNVSSVSPQSVRVNLCDAGTPSGSHLLGARYGRGEVGEFVIVEGQVNHLLGRVSEIKLPEPDRKTMSGPFSRQHCLDAIGSIQLLGSIAMDDLRVTPGVEAYPRLGDRVYAAHHKFVSIIPFLMEKIKSDSEGVHLCVGSIDNSSNTSVYLKPEKIFGRHCAVLGATGGGKSWTTARLIEECLKHNSKVILIDATGEYRGFSGQHVINCHLGTPVELSADSLECSLPPTSFVESDFIALFEPAGKVQGPKLRAAMRSLRLADLRPDLAPNGYIPKIARQKASVVEAEQDRDISIHLDDPRSAFDVGHLVAQIEQECVHSEAFLRGGQKGEKDPTQWGLESGEFSNCLSLISRINGVLTSPAFQCVFASKGLSLTRSIDEFMQGEWRLLRICLSGVAHEYKAREVIANAIGRHLLNTARSGAYKSSPLLTFVDEAHSFLGRNIGSEDSVAKLDAFELIAKEGRKFGLNICLSTQRPRDITEGVLSQMGTMIVHRLTNDRDREVVERACGEIDRAASAFLPNLKQGEAAIIGADFPIPLTVQFKAPTTAPFSDGANFQKYWKLSDVPEDDGSPLAVAAVQA